jgi:DNA repair protein RadC
VKQRNDHEASRFTASNLRPQQNRQFKKYQYYQYDGSRSSLPHNHPTGDPSPSRDDIALTREVRNALKAVGVSLHDHVIIGRKGHCSLRSMNVIDGWK